jgi:polyisoprenoid-binding protein YceI
VNQGTPNVKRHWKQWLIGTGVVVMVLAVGGPFFYIHVIEGKAPAPLKLSTRSSASTTTATGASNAPVAVEGTWKVAAGSVVGYRVKEVLFGQNNTAVGRTSSVTGSLTLQGKEVPAASFTVDLTSMSSDRSQRDHQFQGRIMDTASFPTATFTLTKPIALSNEPADGSAFTAQATGNLTMHGTTRSVTFTVTGKLTGTTAQVNGSIPIVFGDWNITDPSFGPVSTDNHGTLEFLLNLTRA